MKAVLIATDYIKTEDGNYKVLEMNTNASLGVLRDDIDFLDFTELDNFITTNQFTTINIIYQMFNNRFRDKLVDMYEDNTSITINSFETQPGSITVPYIEDNETTLTIRISYDTTAIVDDEYCRDKYNFNRAMGDSTLKPKSYIPDVSDDFSSLTEFNYTGTSPNFIIKKRYPNYDKYEFPKLYKITTLEELNSLKQIVNSSIEVLQEFLECELIDNSLNIIRDISIIYGSNLDIISIGGYKIKHAIPTNIWENTYNSNNELDKKDRPKYITYYYDVETRLNYLADAEDDILMADGNTKLFKDIVVGDELKSIAVSGLPDDETIYGVESWTGSYTDFINNYSIITTTVQHIATSEPVSDLFIKTTLTDGTVWEDVPWTALLVKDGDIIKFKSFNELEIGDVIEMVNIIDNRIVNATIQNLEIVFKYNIILGDINVETKDVYLPIIGSNLAIIQHNACNAICNNRGTYPSCRSFVQCGNCVPAQCQAK